MTRKDIEAQVAYWTKEAAELSQAMRAKLRGASSASISTGSGSKSYTNYSIGDFRVAIASAQRQARAWRAKLRGGSAALGEQVTVIRPGG